MHICFGYAAMVGGQAAPAIPSCPSWPAPPREQISIEAAQPKLDLAVLRDLSGKTIMLGVHRPRRPGGGDRRAGRRAHPRRPDVLPAERLMPAPDCGMKYLPRDRAFGKLQALAQGAAIVRRELGG